METKGINKKINGIDLLLWFQNGHLALDQGIDGLALRHSDEIKDKFANIGEVVKEFLMAINEVQYSIEDDNSDDSGSEVQD